MVSSIRSDLSVTSRQGDPRLFTPKIHQLTCAVLPHGIEGNSSLTLSAFRLCPCHYFSMCSYTFYYWSQKLLLSVFKSSHTVWLRDFPWQQIPETILHLCQDCNRMFNVEGWKHIIPSLMFKERGETSRPFCILYSVTHLYALCRAGMS